jgi:peptidyl-prolyl cis-trans isomerase C
MNTRTIVAVAFAAAVAAEASAADKAAPAAQPPAAPAKPAAEAKPAPKFELKDPVAVVDGNEIKVADLEKAVGEVVAQQGATLDQVPAEVKPKLYRQVLDGVIVEKLVTREAAKIEVTEAAVTQEYNNFLKRFPNEEEMKAQLAKAGQTPESIRGQIQKYLQQNQWLDTQVAGKADVTDAEAQDFYKSNADQFKKDEEVRASHILVKCEQDAKDDEVKTKRETANKILDRVKKGEDFAALAGELSEDPSAKENKGDLSFFPRKGAMVEPFADAAFKLKKGEVSAAPVRSEFGFHIIKVTDRHEGGTVAFDEAKPRLVAYLKDQKRKTETGKILRTLREGAKVTVNLPEAE